VKVAFFPLVTVRPCSYFSFLSSFFEQPPRPLTLLGSLPSPSIIRASVLIGWDSWQLFYPERGPSDSYPARKRFKLIFFFPFSCGRIPFLRRKAIRPRTHLDSSSLQGNVGWSFLLLFPMDVRRTAEFLSPHFLLFPVCRSFVTLSLGNVGPFSSFLRSPLRRHIEVYGTGGARAWSILPPLSLSFRHFADSLFFLLLRVSLFFLLRRSFFSPVFSPFFWALPPHRRFASTRTIRLLFLCSVSWVPFPPGCHLFAAE